MNALQQVLLASINKFEPLLSHIGLNEFSTIQRLCTDWPNENQTIMIYVRSTFI
jgi:hypothetical protein